MYRAFDRQDIEQGRKYMASNIVGHGMDGVTRQGVDAFIEYATSMFGVFPDGYHQIEDIDCRSRQSCHPWNIRWNSSGRINGYSCYRKTNQIFLRTHRSRCR